MVKTLMKTTGPLFERVDLRLSCTPDYSFLCLCAPWEVQVMAQGAEPSIGETLNSLLALGFDPGLSPAIVYIWGNESVDECARALSLSF